MLTVKMTPDDGAEIKVEILARDILTWERAGKGRVLQHFLNNVNMVDLYWLTWTAARRLRLFTGDLRSFEETVEVEPETESEEDEGVDPTRPALSAVTSLPSPSQPASRPRRGPRKASAR